MVGLVGIEPTCNQLHFQHLIRVRWYSPNYNKYALIQLSYLPIVIERRTRIELAYQAWKACIITFICFVLLVVRQGIEPIYLWTTTNNLFQQSSCLIKCRSSCTQCTSTAVSLYVASVGGIEPKSFNLPCYLTRIFTSLASEPCPWGTGLHTRLSYPILRYTLICSGGWTWTTDLKVMGLASWPLLHSAMWYLCHRWCCPNILIS